MCKACKDYVAREQRRNDEREERYRQGLCAQCDNRATFKLEANTNHKRPNGTWIVTYGSCDKCMSGMVLPAYQTPDL